MMNKDISQNRQLGLFRWNFAMVGSKRCAETLQSGSRVKFVDLPLHLLRYKFSLEVWDAEPCISLCITPQGQSASQLTVLLLSSQCLACRRRNILFWSHGQVDSRRSWSSSVRDNCGRISGLSSHGRDSGVCLVCSCRCKIRGYREPFEDERCR